jgi:queuine tRNA-ribosyltransferase
VSELRTAHGPIVTPAFLPDATRGAVRETDLEGVASVGVRALMVNAFHVMLRPGADRVRRLGGLHRFMGWDGPIVTDSGGFQAMSLIRQRPGSGSIRPDGLHYKVPETGRKIRLTPEKCIQVQLQLGSDVIIALDDCAEPSEPEAAQRAATERTVAWARRCREEFVRQLEQRRLGDVRPRLVGVVQGGASQALREDCAGALIELGFDGFGFGGWPLAPDGTFTLELFALLSRILPADAPRFALGVGKPEHVAAVARLGGSWIFDCTIPTRDARHHRLYTFTRDPSSGLGSARDFYRCLYMLDEKHAQDPGPVEAGCDCPCCRRYGRAYLHHLFKVKDAQAARLATLHNLRFYTRLVDALRAEAARA